MSSLRQVVASMLLLVAAAAMPTPVVASPPTATVPVVFAESVSFRGFIRYWRGFVNRTDRVVLVVGLVAAFALFIITRGRWLK